MPILGAYGPDALVLSAGFDAHAADSLGGMQLSTDGYAVLTRRLWAFAADRCAGRLAVTTEGGYDLQALEECLDSTLEVCAADPPSSIPPVRGSTAIAAAALDSVLRAQSPYWPGIG